MYIDDDVARDAYLAAWRDTSGQALSMVPHYMRGGFYRWVVWGIKGGDFLHAVVRNDFMGAVRAADDENSAALPAWAAAFYNAAPAACFGSDALAERWHQKGGLLGRCHDCDIPLDVPERSETKAFACTDGGVCARCADRRVNEKHAAQLMGD